VSRIICVFRDNVNVHFYHLRLTNSFHFQAALLQNGCYIGCCNVIGNSTIAENYARSPPVRKPLIPLNWPNVTVPQQSQRLAWLSNQQVFSKNTVKALPASFSARCANSLDKRELRAYSPWPSIFQYNIRGYLAPSIATTSRSSFSVRRIIVTGILIPISFSVSIL